MQKPKVSASLVRNSRKAWERYLQFYTKNVVFYRKIIIVILMEKIFEIKRKEV